MKIALLYFKIFPIKIYTLLHAFEPIVEALLPIRLIDFFERLTNCIGSNAKKFFWQSNIHAILNVCWCVNLMIGHMTILQYQLAHSINGFRNNNWFCNTFTKFVLERTTTSVEFTIPSINTGPWWSFIAKNLIKFIDALLLS